ncbi:MAG: hypothetical protein VB934_21350 [Polyangiaceae bacterium]
MARKGAPTRRCRDGKFALFAGVAAAGVLAVSARAHAQSHDAAVRLDGLQPASAGSPFIRAEGPRDSFDRGMSYAVRLTGDYALKPLTTRVVQGAPNSPGETSDKALVRHALLLHVGAALAPLDWLTLEANLPIAVMERGEDDLSVNAQTMRAGKAGVGDIRLGLLFTPLNREKLDVGFGARAWAATGSRAAYMSDAGASPRIEATAFFAAKRGAISYACTTGIAPLFFAGRDGDRLALSCAAAFRLSSLTSFVAEPHIALYSFRSADGPGGTTPGLGNADLAPSFEPLGALVFHAGPLMIKLAGGAGFGGAPGTAAARGILSVSYQHQGDPVAVQLPPPDRDLDGIPDSYDACPDAAGQKEQRGCPRSADDDGDGILEDDACPREAGPAHDDPRGHGCPDRDNDHIPNPIDSCPIEPGTPPTGCPTYARLKEKEFVSTPPLRFVRGRSMLTAESLAALSEIMSTTRANPTIAQLSVVIGTRRVRRKLADARAAQVHKLFKDTGFDNNRYEVVLDGKARGGQIRVRVIR